MNEIAVVRSATNIRLFFFCVSMLLAYSALCQGKSNIIKTYFNDGNISTLLTHLSNEIDRGSAIAFDHSGKEIYHMEVRRYAGNANVEFKFHPNGAVYTAHYTSHPDGGIQWSDITHYFDEQGNVTRVEDNSSDDFGRPTLHIQPVERESIPQQIIAPEKDASNCAEIMITRIYAINKCHRKVRLTKEQSVASSNDVSFTKWISYNDTVFISSVLDADQFSDIKARIHPEFFLGRKQKFAETLWSEPYLKSKNERHYFLYVFE